MNRRVRGVAAISLADLMIGFLAVVLLFLQLEMKKAQKMIDKAQEITREEVVKRDEIQKQKAELEAEVAALRKKKWKLIATEWRIGGADQVADVSLYCLRDGVHTSPQGTTPMTDTEILAWIKSRPKSAEELLIYQENGANDAFLQAQAAINKSGRFDSYGLMTLPSELDPRK